MNWLTLKDNISEKQSYLDKMFFGTKDDDKHFPFPPLLSANSFAAINLVGKSSELGRLAIILPHSETVACYIAAAAAFAGIIKQEESGFLTLPPLLLGEKFCLTALIIFTKAKKFLVENLLWFLITTAECKKFRHANGFEFNTAFRPDS